jgi:hypothetical protein
MARYSPWIACGADYDSYSAGMRRTSHLRLLRAECRLVSGDTDVEGAARQWESLFGIRRKGNELLFRNMRLRFVGGRGKGW